MKTAWLELHDVFVQPPASMVIDEAETVEQSTSSFQLMVTGLSTIIPVAVFTGIVLDILGGVVSTTTDTGEPYTAETLSRESLAQG